MKQSEERTARNGVDPLSSGSGTCVVTNREIIEHKSMKGFFDKNVILLLAAMHHGCPVKWVSHILGHCERLPNVAYTREDLHTGGTRISWKFLSPNKPDRHGDSR